MRRNKKTKKERDTKNVIIYCRVSSDEQKKGSSLEVQEERLVRECQRRKYNIIDIPHWEDESGKTFVKRPVMSNILQYIKKHSNDVDMLLCLRWNRFSRKLSQATNKIDELREKYDVEVNTIEEPINYDSALWTTQIGMYIGQAESDNLTRSKGTKDGIHGTLEKGKWPNRAPRGYKNIHVTDDNGFVIDKLVEIDPDVSPIISKVFIEIAKGIEAPCYIRRKLCPFIPESSFLEMIRNPFYKGFVFVPEFKGIKEHLKKGVHKAIIDEETFDKVQEILDGKQKHNPKLTKAVNPDLFLRKFLVCPICGHALTGSVSKGNGGKYAYYHCCQNGKHLRKRAEEVNESFARYVSCLTPNEEVLSLYKEVLSDVRNEQGRETRNKVEDLQKEVRHVEDMLNTLDDKLMSGTISDANYNRISQRYDKQINELKQQIEIMKNPNRANIEPKLSYSISLLDNMERFIRDAPVEAKIKLLGSIFPKKIEFDGIKYRTNEYNKVLDLIYQQTNELREPKKENEERFDSFPASVPRAGVEPARVAPLVFETSASTDSAIWAYVVAKVHIFSELTNFYQKKH